MTAYSHFRAKRIVLASNNPGKLSEFSALFEPLGITLIPQGKLGVSEISEPHCTFLENALLKARHASAITGLPALGDDSGLCVPALGDAPGVRSARYAAQPGGAKSAAANSALLVHNLQGVIDRRARYVAVLVLVVKADDPQPVEGEGVWQGEIIDTPRGTNGFGYDPHFYLPDLHMTVAELPAHHKNQISHRAQALSQLLGKLDSRRF
jgi:XTP/dITP diphosphohydrolase